LEDAVRIMPKIHVCDYIYTGINENEIQIVQFNASHDRLIDLHGHVDYKRMHAMLNLIWKLYHD